MTNNEALKQHQSKMLCMLKEINRICSKHKIKYMLFAGSCLGAVRHNGFIPWDDDLDIIMLREEYDKFLKYAEMELDKKQFYLQKEFSNHWPMFYSKFRMNNTTCFEGFYPNDKLMHQGIYVDIFPCDNLSDCTIKRYLQFFSSKVIIAKALGKRGYICENKLKKIFINLCKILPNKFFLKFVINQKNKESKYVHSFLGGGSRYVKNIYPREWFENVTDVIFEESVFPISSYFDDLLKNLYGDYMQIPSEDERKCKKHNIFVDCEKSYVYYLDIQKNLKIDNICRSIR